MNLDTITEKLEQHPEQAFIVKSLLMIVLIIGTKVLLGQNITFCMRHVSCSHNTALIRHFMLHYETGQIISYTYGHIMCS